MRLVVRGGDVPLPRQRVVRDREQQIGRAPIDVTAEPYLDVADSTPGTATDAVNVPEPSING